MGRGLGGPALGAMPPTVAFTAAAAPSSSDSDAHEGRLEAALPDVPPALLCQMFPQVRCTVTLPATPLHPTPLHPTPLSLWHRAARAQIFSAQADFFSRFLGDAEASGASQLAQRVLAVTFGSTAGRKPEQPEQPKQPDKISAGQLAIDRKKILSLSLIHI